MPLISVGFVMEVQANLKHPRDPRKIRKLDGTYVVNRTRIVYSTQKPSRAGLTQYLEIGPVKIPDS